MRSLVVFWDEPLNLTGGGIHRTISSLLQHLPKRGFEVLYVYSLDKYQTFHHTQDDGTDTVICLSELKDFLISKNCRYILGQEATFSSTFTTVIDNLGLENVKLINQYHGSLLYFDKKLTLHYLWLEWQMNKDAVTRLGLLVRACMYPLWKLKIRRTQRRIYKFNYEHSDMSVLLSSYEKPLMGKISGDLSLGKCISIPNPLSWEKVFKPESIKNKAKEVLIVSRIYNPEKRIDLALRVWKILQERGVTKEWKLRIVGDGIHKDYLEQLSKEMMLENVIWEGRQNPMPYYERASIFLLTSAVEGWALTLTEAMQSAVVPIAFDSYPAVREIIEDGFNGFLIPNKNIKEYANQLERLMTNQTLRIKMALNGLESCNRFDIDKVMDKWAAMLRSL